MCNVGRVARAGAANLRERGQSGTVTRPSTIQCLHYNLLNIVARPPTVLCVYLLSTPNDSGRVVMRLDMVYAPSSINYNLYPPSYIPPSIQNNCKKSQFVTSKITVKSHKMWLVIRYKRSMLSDCIQCWSQLTAQLSSQQSLTCSSQVLFLKKLSFHCIGFFWFSRDRTICGQAPDIRLTGRLLLHARCIVL